MQKRREKYPKGHAGPRNSEKLAGTLHFSLQTKTQVKNVGIPCWEPPGPAGELLDRFNGQIPRVNCRLQVLGCQNVQATEETSAFKQ
jgi:hypothetical protein